MKIRRSMRLNSSIDMTPIIDVVFQLLTFFMLTSTFIKTSAINVDLPRSVTSDSQPDRQAVVTLYRNGNMTLFYEDNSGKTEIPVTIDNLGGEVKKLYVGNNNVVVTIRGDKGVAYGSLIEAMDVIRLAGVRRLSLATTQKE